MTQVVIDTTKITATSGAAILYPLDGTNPDTMARGSTLIYTVGSTLPISAATTPVSGGDQRVGPGLHGEVQ